MSEEILVNVTPQETRVAFVENGVLQEVLIERARRRGFVGNIYLGRINRVLPGMGAAFVDIGLQRAAFLHVSDIESADARKEATGIEVPIEQAVHEGQQILVQVTKEPLGTKGARLSTYISIPSRYLVFMPYSNSLGISQRIEQEEERRRLRDIVLGLQPNLSPLSAPLDESRTPSAGPKEPRTGGFIVRTAAEGAAAADLQADMLFLLRLWSSIEERLKLAQPPCAVYEDLPLVLRIIRDLSATQAEKIRVDSRETFTKVTAFAEEFTPELAPLIEHYPGERPILDLYSTEDEIQRALQRKVDLKSGGHLVLDQTEAMTTIDVNTGGFVGHRNLEETIFKTNLEAAQAIARQLRLRNLGGIIIVDFIDMVEDEHRRQVLRALEKSLERDHSKISVSDVTSLGLVQITRKRTRESLEHVLCEPCPTCNARGSIKSAETVCYELFREILREQRQFDARKLLVVASQTVVDLLLDEESTSIAELEVFIGIPIRFQVESTYTQEQYDVVLL
ncbi:MAG: Rne/Rng family ribonuclease [Gammaproteobacteria bacterium]|nr:Rne/Rng family ribonuclease [Gammaproteobacteria bacterium]